MLHKRYFFLYCAQLRWVYYCKFITFLLLLILILFLSILISRSSYNETVNSAPLDSSPTANHTLSMLSFHHNAIFANLFTNAKHLSKFPVRTKNPAPQDSPPAAGRICDIFLFCRSAILTECFCVIGKFDELSYNKIKLIQRLSTYCVLLDKLQKFCDTIFAEVHPACIIQHIYFIRLQHSPAPP